MRKAFFLLLICLVLIAPNCYGISLAKGYVTAQCGFNATAGGNTSGIQHVHVSTRPTMVYKVVVTAVATGGWAALIETKDAGVDQGISGITTAGSREGMQYVSEGTTKADVVVGTANNTIEVTFEDGLPFGNQLFVDCSLARATVYYRE